MTQTFGRKRQAKLKKYTKRNAEQSRKFEFIYQNAKKNKKEFERIHKKLEEHDREFLLIHKKLKENDDTHERIVNKLLEHDVRLENIEQNMATKQDLNEIKSTLDAFLASHGQDLHILKQKTGLV